MRNVLVDHNVVNAVRQYYGGPAFSLNNPNGNPPSGDVVISNTTGTWVYSEMNPVPSDTTGLTGIVVNQYSSAENWYNVTVSGNVNDGNTAWSFP